MELEAIVRKGEGLSLYGSNENIEFLMWLHAPASFETCQATGNLREQSREDREKWARWRKRKGEREEGSEKSSVRTSTQRKN